MKIDCFNPRGSWTSLAVPSSVSSTKVSSSSAVAVFVHQMSAANVSCPGSMAHVRPNAIWIEWQRATPQTDQTSFTSGDNLANRCYKQWKKLPQEMAHLSADDQLFGLDVLFILTNLFSGFNWQLCWKFISMSVAMFTFDALNSIFCVCHKRNNWNQLQIGTLLIGEGVKTCFPMHPIAWVQLFTFWLLLLTTTHSPDMRQTTWIGFGKRSILIPLSTALLEYPYGFAS